MLLQRLKEYADHRMELPPQLYSETAVRYIIELTIGGRFLGMTDTADPANPKTKRGQRYLMPQVTRAVGISPLLLADKADYTLGIGGEQSKPERVAACHRAYLDMLNRCAAATQAAEILAVQAFLNGDRAELRLPNDFDPSGLITFRVDEVFPTELEAVQSFWAREHASGGDEAIVMQCIVCGEQRPVLDRLQGKIKGIPGGQMAGTSIISANANAFESYRLEASLIAPTCGDCGERFTKALNYFLNSEQHRVILAGMAFVFWTLDPDVGFDFSAALSRPEPQQVVALYQSLRSGKPQSGVNASAFYAVTMSASGGRAVVRDWLDTTVWEAKRALARWFERQQLTDDTGSPAPPLGLYGLAGATVRELKDLPVTTARALVRSALIGTPLPMGLLYQAVRRSRAEQNVTRQRAALIKLVLLSQHSEQQEGYMVDLDLQNSNPAYRCGRLLAVLAEIQRNAIGKAAIVDRFYGTASSAPVAVFGRLVRGAQPHLTKLERDRPGVARILQQRLEEVMSGLTTFPTILTLEEQGLFALGFYHQRAYDRAQMIERAARRRAGEQSAQDEALETEDQGTSS
jgi:CRISPR-associated protein Csd1